MRTLTDHQTNATNDALAITVVDEPGQGGACHRYDVTGFDVTDNPAARDLSGYKSTFIRLPVIFQNGPIKEFGVNGVTQEALLAIVIDRLKSFQAGPFACQENAEALFHATESLRFLKSRTTARVARGVEGTNAK